MEEKNVRVITLSDFWNIFFWHMIPMILAAVLCVTGVYLYAHFVRQPLYRSTASLYILRREREDDYANSNSDFSLALNVVNDCNYMLKSHAVLDEVLDELKLDMEYKKLAQIISTLNPDGTRVLEVSVVTDSPELSKKIVDSLCKIGARKISAAMGFEQVNVYEYGTLAESPSNGIGLRKYALIGVCAALAVYIAYLLAFILDDKIRTEEDVNKYLKISVLGDIPNAASASGGKYSKYSKYGRYARYSRYGRKGKYGKYYSYGSKGVYGAYQAKPEEGQTEQKEGGKKE